MSDLFSSKHNLNFSHAPSLNSQSAQPNYEIGRTSLLETLIEIAFDAIFITDTNGVITEVNARSCQLLGYEREELLGKAISELICPEELPHLLANRTSLEQSNVSTQIWNHLHKDGSRIPGEVNTRILPDGRWVAIVRDLSDRLRIESNHNRVQASLQQSEERLQLALRGSGQGIWDWDLKTQILTWDDRCKEIFGLPPNFPVTYEWHLNALHPEDLQRVFDATAMALRDYTEFDEEYRTFHPNGIMRWVLARGRGYYDAAGEPYRMSGTVLDISDRKRLEQNQQFLLNLDYRLRQLPDASAMAWEVVSSLGEYLDVDRCLWHEIDWEDRSTTVERNWRREDVPDVTGIYALEDYFTPQQLERFAAGQTLIVHDVTTHPDTAPYAQNYLPLGAAAFVSVPCIHSGCWVAVLAVNAKTARNWRDDEVTLLQETVARLWSIIEQTRAMHTLREYEERTRLATEAANLGMWFWDIPNNELVWTNRCKLLFGLAVETQMSYDLFLTILHSGDRERTHLAVTQALEQEVEYNIEYRVVCPDGSIRWIAAKGRGFYNANGQPIRMMGTAQDISERKIAEAELQERNEHIRLLYETTRDLLSTDQPLTLVETLFAKLKSFIELDVYFNYLLDKDKQYLHLSFYCGISEQTAREIEWLEMGCAICGTVAQQRTQIVQPDLQGSTDPKTALVRSLGLTAYSCQPLIAQGKLFGTLGFGSCTRTKFTSSETKLFQALCDQIAIALERAELMSSLQQQTAELTRVNHLKDEFLASLSHELRTPLNPILGWTKLIKRQKLTPAKTAEALDTIERNVKQQISLVNDLLDVSSVIQGKLDLELCQVDLLELLNTAIKTVQFAAEVKGITICALPNSQEHRLSDESPPPITGDSDRLRQIFCNLLSNAIKFTPNGGRVEVDLSIVTNENTNRYAQVRVTDNGIGITPEFLPYVFDHFRQADGSSTRRYGGLGLGLSIVRHLVELHGGTVTAESQGVGQGATFIVKLPLRTEVSPLNQLASSEASSQPTTTNLLSGIRILLVDDDPDNLDLLRFLLQQNGAIVTSATSALKALEIIIPDNFPDLIISDIGMRGMNGYEFIQQVRALPQGQQVLALAFTAFARQENQEEALRSGFQAYISKPVDPLELLTTLTQLVAR